MKRNIEASTTVRAALPRVRDVLVDDPGVVFADHPSGERRPAPRFHSVLSVDVGAGAAIQQQVVIDVEPGRLDEEVLVLPLQWRAMGRERLFPSFAGELRASPHRAGTRLELRGDYAVPLGTVGRFGDGVLGRRLARRSLATFLEHVARRLDAEVDRRMNSVAWRPAVYAVDLRERDSHAEIYVG